MVGLALPLLLVGASLAGMELANPTGYLGALGGAAIAAGIACLFAPAPWALCAFLASLAAFGLYFKLGGAGRADGGKRRGGAEEKGR